MIERGKMNSKREIIPLYYDKAFKIIFNNAKRPMIKLLNKLTRLDIPYNANIVIGEEIMPNHIKGKLYRQDIMIDIDETTFICIEMNNDKYEYSINRNIIYLFSLLINKLKEKESNKKLDTHRGRLININNFTNKTKKPIERIRAVYDGCNKSVTELFEIYNIDIEKCHKMMYNESIEKNDIIRIGSIFRAKTLEELSTLLGGDLLTMEEKKELIEAVDMANSNKELLDSWAARFNLELKERAVRDGYTNEGILKGMKTGIKEGIKEGKAEERLSIIKNMLMKKAEYSFISEVTGRSIQEIKSIESSM